MNGSSHLLPPFLADRIKLISKEGGRGGRIQTRGPEAFFYYPVNNLVERNGLRLVSSDCSPPQPRNHKHGRPIIIGLGYILRVHCASSKTIRGRSRKVRSLSRNGGGERERERGILSFLLRLQIRSISHGLSLSLVSPFQRDKNSFPPRLRVSPLRYLSHFPLERFTAILGVSVCLG